MMTNLWPQWLMIANRAVDIQLSRGGLERIHDDVIKWKHFPRYWSFVRGIHRSPVNSPHKDQWRGVLMFSLICAWTNGLVNWRRRWFETPWRSLWRHYDVAITSHVRHGVSNNRQIDNVFNCLFRHTTKKTLKLSIIGPFVTEIYRATVNRKSFRPIG